MTTANLFHRLPIKPVGAALTACGTFEFSAVQMQMLSTFVKWSLNLKWLFHLDFFKRTFVSKATASPIPADYETIIVNDFLNTNNLAAETVGTASLNREILEIYRDHVLAIDTPLLLMVGELDKTIPPEGMTFLYEKRNAFPAADTTLATFPALGHLPMLEDTPSFSETLRQHIQHCLEKSRVSFPLLA
jgi:pimeloyl-ACP methyl ester carboxylesterase